MKISAVVLTKNEEKNIKACLESLSFCDEIVVVDDFSEDKTVKIAKEMEAKVFRHSLDNDFSQQRNFGLKKAKGEWVLFVDGDERVSAALAAEINQNLHSGLRSFTSSHPRGVKAHLGGVTSLRMTQKGQNDLEKVVGFYLKRKDFIFGRWLRYGETGKTKLLRLAKKDAGQWQGKVHEIWKVKGETKILENPLLHCPHPTVKEFLRQIDQYSTIRAEELYQQGKRTNFLEILAYPIGKFWLNFIVCLGFLDGLPGFLQAMMMSFHSFLVRGKLWLKQ